MCALELWKNVIVSVVSHPVIKHTKTYIFSTAYDALSASPYVIKWNLLCPVFNVQVFIQHHLCYYILWYAFSATISRSIYTYAAQDCFCVQILSYMLNTCIVVLRCVLFVHVRTLSMLSTPVKVQVAPLRKLFVTCWTLEGLLSGVKADMSCKITFLRKCCVT